MQHLFGFTYDKKIFDTELPTYSLERVCFRYQKMLPEFVWDAGVLEGNPFTFVEVKTLMDGVTVGGHKLSDAEQITNLAISSKELLRLVKENKFELNKQTFTHLHSLVALNEALEWGHFRGEGKEHNYTPHVSLGEKGSYKPPTTKAGAGNLNQIFESALVEFQKLPPVESAFIFFLFGALQQFFFDGNKRTSRHTMNGILMVNGYDAVSIPAAKAQEFNQKMVDFYISKNADVMIDFLFGCAP